MVPDLNLAAAKYVLGLIPSWELPPIADAALNRGQYSDSLGELAYLRDPVMSDAGPLFEASLVELNIPLPPKDTAIQVVLIRCIRRIADQLDPPYEGLCNMMQDVYYRAMWDEKPKQFQGDSRGIEHLIGAYYYYDDLRELPYEASSDEQCGAGAIAALDVRVIELAREWLSQHAA